jgi:hypothetical protein
MTNNLDNIFDFIKENRKDIFAFVENNKYISSFDEYIAHNNENIFDKLVINLIANFPLCHCNPIDPSHREYDKVHFEFAKAILEIFWCVCLSQMKENGKAYQPGTTELFRKLLFQIFQLGKDYASIEENRRSNFSS